MGIWIRTQYNKFKVFMFAYWAMMLGVSGMYTMYIVQAGFSKMEISIAVTVFTFFALLGQSIIGYLADRFKCVKKILSVSIGIGATAAAAIVLFEQSRHIIALIFLWGFFLHGTIPLSEAWYIEVLKNNGAQKEFGKIRGLGSVGYGLSGVLLGFLLQSFGWRIYSTYILVSAGIVLAVILVMDENQGAAFYKNGGGSNAGYGSISIKEAFHEIAKIKPLKSIIIIIFIYNFVVKGIYSYLGVLVSDFGGGPLSLGFTYFFDAAPEMITFFLTTRLLSRYRNKELIFAAFILQIIRLSFILIFKNSLAIILLGSLSGFAYGLLATAYKTFIYELAPENYKISCLSLSESIIGFAGVISAPVFGFVIMKFSGYTSIAMGLLIYVAAALFIARSLYRKE